MGHQSLKQDFKPRDFHSLFKKLQTTNNQGNGLEDMNFGLPHKQRLCIVVDRRKGLKNQNHKSQYNELFMYKPPKGGKIPAKHQKGTITAKTVAKGYMVCLSFKVNEKNQIQCHLYSQGQMLRFMPSDVYDVLPYLFNVTKGDQNDKFLKKKEKININFYDSEFDKFRKQTQK